MLNLNPHMVLPAVVALLLLFASGLLLSRIRFCMVGTVGQALRGEWADTQATLIICSMITGVLLLAGLAEHRPLEQYGVHCACSPEVSSLVSQRPGTRAALSARVFS